MPDDRLESREFAHDVDTLITDLAVQAKHTGLSEESAIFDLLEAFQRERGHALFTRPPTTHLLVYAGEHLRQVETLALALQAAPNLTRVQRKELGIYPHAQEFFKNISQLKPNDKRLMLRLSILKDRYEHNRILSQIEVYGEGSGFFEDRDYILNHLAWLQTIEEKLMATATPSSPGKEA